jgi:hypothetical protein
MEHKDLTGKKFAKWTVLRRVEPEKVCKFIWLCKCECGEEREVFEKYLIAGLSLRCDKCAKANGRRIKHGKVGTTTYFIWSGIIQRCCNPKSNGYKYYGGRGIRVCDRWKKSFANFLNDMGERPNGLTIERKNNDGDYEPTNCIWADYKTQANNRRFAINDEFTKLIGIKSYVYIHQLRMKRDHRCVSCGDPIITGSYFCEKHRKISREYQRNYKRPLSASNIP